MKTGCTWYVGVTGSGKTWLAWAELSADIALDGRPALILDAQADPKFSGIPEAPTVDAAIRRVWGDGLHARIIPRTLDDARRLAAAAHAGGRCHVLIDEAAFWMRANSVPEELGRGMRAHRHSQTTWRFTTQHLADIPPLALQCASRMEVFRCSSPSVLERLSREYGLDAAKVQALGRGDHLTWSAGL